jgi:hypothetical protein
MRWKWQNSYNGALGGTRTHRTWFLRPVRMPFRHQGMVVMVGIDPTSSPYGGGAHPSTPHDQ